MSSARVNVFLKTGVCLVLVLFSCENGGGGREGFHDFVNDAIIPAVFSGIRVVEGNYAEEGGLLVVGAGRTVMEITLENSRNTEYPLEILGGDKGLVEMPPEFDGRSLIRLALECPENGDERILDITLHLGQPPGRAQPADYRLPLKYALKRIQFFHIIPDALSGPVTKLVLVLDKEIPGLSPDSISVTADGGAPFRPDSLVWVSDGICEIGIKEITPAKSIAVEIAPGGYRRESLSVDVNANPAPGEIQFLYAGAHDSNGTTEKLTLVFNQDVPGGLLSSDITVPVTITGDPVRKAAGVYELAVIVTESGTVDVAVAKSGYSIVPGSQPVEVRYVVPVKFESVTADGSATADTTKLTLKFDRDIAGLAASDITLDAGITGAGTGTLTKTAGTGNYDLSLTNIKAAGTVWVTVRKDGYHFEPESITEGVHYVIPVKFEDVTADGSDTATTSRLTLKFDRDIAGLAANDITLDAGITGAGTLAKTGTGTYDLPLIGIKAAGEVKVTVHKGGYHIVPEFLSEDVHYTAPAVLRSVTASGTIANGKLVPYPSKAEAGQSVKVYLYPDTTYVYKEYSLKLVDYTGGTPVKFDPQSDGTFTFTMPDADVVLTAQFFQPEAKLAVGGNVQYFETLKEAFTAVSTGAATITVLKDVTVSEEIAMEGTVTLVAADGKEKTISRESGFKDSLFTVEAGASLTLGAGNSLGLALDGSKSSVTATAALVKVSGGTLTMGERITLKNNSSNGGEGGGVRVDGGGTFVMNGGEMSGNAVSGGNGGGGAVYVIGNSIFTMNGGTISNNTSGIYGGGVYVNSGKFNMSGDSKISGNTSVKNGGGVYANGCAFQMSNGTISSNTSTTEGNGGGLYLSSNSSLTMTGGVFSGNTAINGNGVYINGTFTMSGTAVVKQEVYLENGKQITVSGALMPPGGVSAEIRLATPNNNTEVVKGAGSYSLTFDDVSKFKLSHSGMGFSYDSESNTATLADGSSGSTQASYSNGGTPLYGGLKEIIGYAAGTAAAPAVISLANDMTLANGDNISLASGQHIKLTVTDGKTKTVERGNGNSGSLFTIQSGASLTLEGSGSGILTLDGKDLPVGEPLVAVSGGTLTMGSGVKLANNKKNSNGDSGGVWVFNSGTFTMNGGEISGNTAEHGGGGVSVGRYMQGSGTFTMNGGTISDNTAGGGGGVQVSSGSTFTMNSGEISNNKAAANDGKGGGVFINGNLFVMNGGKISNNTCNSTSEGGGGVFVNNGSEFQMDGGEISGNTAKNNGGGVFVNIGSAKFTMTSGTISGNTANSQGGGVYQSGGTFTMSDGTIYGSNADDLSNTASNGAAYYKNDGTPPSGLDTTSSTIIKGVIQ
jgi:hypothetical protein